ncbi:MAG: hypothetical protein KGH64_06280, partial [Candidatus Micrarchaeota archaeon]|nr:hypothetical protein [Candidatus Micrarchaeota archaeon]
DWLGAQFEYSGWHIYHRNTGAKKGFWSGSPREIFIKVILTASNRPDGKKTRYAIFFLETAIILLAIYYYASVQFLLSSVALFGINLGPLAEIFFFVLVGGILFEALTYELYTRWLLGSYTADAKLVTIPEVHIKKLVDAPLRPVLEQSPYQEHYDMIMKRKDKARRRLEQIREVEA